MAFSKAPLKRFNEGRGCAPAVGTYYPKDVMTVHGAFMEKVDRFNQAKVHRKLQQDLCQKEQQLLDTQNQLETLQQEQSASLAVFQQKEHQLAETQKKMAELETKFQAAQQALQDKEQQLNKIQRELQEIRQQHQKEQEFATMARQQVQDLQKKLEEKEQEHSQAEGRPQELHQELDQKDLRLEEFQQELGKKQLDDNIRSLKDKYGAQEREIVNQKAIKQQLENQVAVTEKSHRETVREQRPQLMNRDLIQSLSKFEQSAHIAKVDAEAKVKKLEAEIKQHQITNCTLKMQIASLTESIKELKDKLKRSIVPPPQPTQSNTPEIENGELRRSVRLSNKKKTLGTPAAPTSNSP